MGRQQKPEKVDDVASEVLAKTGDATPGIADEEAGAAFREAQEDAQLRDKHGRPFDPRIHKTDAAGRPIKSDRTGLLHILPGKGGADAKLGSGSPPSGAASRSKLPPPAAATGAATTGAEPEDFRGLAELIVANVTNLATITLGPPWKAEGHEAAAMTDAWEKYLRAKGVSEVPPGALLAVTMSGYALPRVLHQDTRSRVRRGVDRLRRWRKGPKEAPAAPVQGEASDPGA